jgi:hypothetical protein
VKFKVPLDQQQSNRGRQDDGLKPEIQTYQEQYSKLISTDKLKLPMIISIFITATFFLFFFSRIMNMWRIPTNDGTVLYFHQIG